MQKKSISLKIFISKGELDLEMLQEGGGSVVLWAGQGTRSQGSWLAVLALPPTHCVTVGKSLILPVPQSTIIQNLM